MRRLFSMLLCCLVLVALVIDSAPAPGHAANLEVTSAADSGPGTLRQMLLDATPGDTITFSPAAFPPASPVRIQPLSAFPLLDKAGLTLDATGAGVILDGFRAGSGADGLTMATSGCLVRGLTIQQFGGVGLLVLADATNNTVERNVIVLNGGSGIEIRGKLNRIQGNLVGVDPAGAQVVAGNEYNGVAIWKGATGNVVGGDLAVQRNVIGGNRHNGVWIDGASTRDNQVIGNYVGVWIDGLHKAPNLLSGVSIQDGGYDNVIRGNLISGNTDNGIWIGGSGSNGNRVLGNRIGVAPDGLSAVGQGDHGIVITLGASSNVIGDGTPAGRNLISGNTNDGILIEGAATSGNIVQGNYVGTNATGSASLPNGVHGVELKDGAHDNLVGGDRLAGQGNLISGNTHDGILIEGAATSGNIVQGNYVGTNATGSASLPNGLHGVELKDGAHDNLVGGDRLAGQGNLISGNTNHGFLITSGAHHNIVSGNIVGPDAAGDHFLGNQPFGAADITNGAHDNTIGGLTTVGQGNLLSGHPVDALALYNNEGQPAVTDNRILGNWIGIKLDGAKPLPNHGYGIMLGPGAVRTRIEGNVIAFNETYGILVARCEGNTITANSIYSNLLAGIKLEQGGNCAIASPRIISATCTHASGTAPPNVTIELFSDAEDEGRVYEGTTTSWPSGVWEFSKSRAFRLGRLTATQTDAAGNTSEFSPPYQLPGCASTYLPLVYKPAPTPTPTRTPTPTATPSPTPSLTPTATATPNYFEGPWEAEPNNPGTLANGPLRSGRAYFGYPNDSYDYFFFDVHTPGQIVVDLANHTGKGVQLQLYYLNSGEMVRIKLEKPYHIEYAGQDGRYFIVIYTASDFNSSTPYTLKATFP